MANDVREKIAAEVRAEVARQGRTQQDIAVILGVDRTGMWRRFRAKQPYTIEELTKIAEALAVPVEQFLRGEQSVSAA